MQAEGSCILRMEREEGKQTSGITLRRRVPTNAAVVQMAVPDAVMA